LPITLTVLFDFKWSMHNGEKIENIQVRPFSSVKDLLPLIEARCKAKGDAITDWHLEKLTFKLKGPLALAGDEESKEQLGPMS
jgi:hypothetical protein